MQRTVCLGSVVVVEGAGVNQDFSCRSIGSNHAAAYLRVATAELATLNDNRVAAAVGNRRIDSTTAVSTAILIAVLKQAVVQRTTAVETHAAAVFVRLALTDDTVHQRSIVV